jgi:hypothetical protein
VQRRVRQGEPPRLGLADNPGLIYAQNQDGVVLADNDRSVLYFDQFGSSPPGPGIGIYKVSPKVGRPSLLAYGTDASVSANGRYLALDPEQVQLHDPLTPPTISVVDLVTGRRTSIVVSSLLPSGRLTADRVSDIVWVAGSDVVAVRLQPQRAVSGARCGSVGFSPPSVRTKDRSTTTVKCPPPPPPLPASVALVRIAEGSSSPVASAVGELTGVTEPWELAVSGPEPGTIMVIGRPTSAASGPYRAFVLDLTKSPVVPIEVGQVPASCYPLSVDMASGSVLCQPTGGQLSYVRLGRSSPPVAIPLPRDLTIGNATW